MGVVVFRMTTRREVGEGSFVGKTAFSVKEYLDVWLGGRELLHENTRESYRTAVALLSGCSATSGSDSPSRAAAVGEAQDTAMVMVQIDDTEASGEVGDTFSILESYEKGATFVVDNPGILEVTQPRKVGEEAINASALALAIGTATVTGRFPDGSAWDYFITVKPAPTQ